MKDHTENYILLSNLQLGFRRGRSTVSNLLVCDTQLASLLNNAHCADMIMTEFSDDNWYIIIIRYDNDWV